MSRDLSLRLLLVIAAPALFFILTEALLYALDLPAPSSDPNFAEMVRLVDAQEFFYEVDPELFWRLKPNLRVRGEATHIRTNSEGFRGLDLREREDPADLRLLLLGDSVTFGYGVPEDATIGARLRAGLQAALPGRKVEVLNAGVPGYTSLQGLHLLRRLGERVAPDVLIVSFGFNDARDMFASDQEIMDVGRSTMSIRRVLYASRLYRLLRSVLVRSPEVEGGAPVARVGPERYMANLAEMTAWARRHGVTPIFWEPPFQRPTLQPFGPASFTLHDSVAVYRRGMRRVARSEGVTCVSVPPLTEAHAATNGTLFLDPAHPNPDGLAIVAEALLAAVTRLLIEVSPSSSAARPF